MELLVKYWNIIFESVKSFEIMKNGYILNFDCKKSLLIQYLDVIPPPLLWEKISLIPVYVGSMGWEEKNSLGHNYNREDTVQHFNHPSLYQNMALGREVEFGIL